jgi:hypothetical protein
VLVGALVLTGLAIIAAHAPPRVRLLGLFPVAHGLIAGWLLTQVAAGVRRQTSRGATLLATALIAASLLGTTFESHRMFAAKVRAQFTAAATDLLDGKWLSQLSAGATAKERAEFERVKQDLAKARRDRRRLLSDRSSFRDYLGHRVLALGVWRSPWPQLLWACEILLATTAGTFLFHKGGGDIDATSSESLS